MVQFRRHDNAHWYHETQRSGGILAVPMTNVHCSDNSFNINHLSHDENTSGQDAFLLGLAEGIPVTLDNALQHHAPILRASVAMYQVLFPVIVEPAHDNTFSLYDRLSSALTVAQVTGVQRLCSHYAARLTPLSSPDASRESNMRLTQITQYARQLASQPTLIDRHALQQLAEVGLTHADIIVLTQIIGFIGYQARVVAGLSAQAGYPTVMLPGFPRMEDATADQLPQIESRWQGWLPELVATPTEPQVNTALTLNQLLAYHPLSSHAYNAITAQVDKLQLVTSDLAPTVWHEWVSLVSSRINGSLFCQAYHQHNLQQLTEGSSLLAALQIGVDCALASQTDEQITHQLIYVSAELTRAPERFSQQHISPLLTLGISNEQLLSVIFNTATAGWANRLRHTLGHAA
ncbi:Uncharacterized protein conserved in bacteria [Yersinia frederiksenii]|uniref:Uncharacterized protein conserved in bacteria n=2 Tax=Yersinia frederiksenii TaxID=29484 RepID=A0A380PQ45_YERFR|nr:carboxymuconolactone decarboxylase family protein [Yersinia frederiksenii]ATM95947.1 hypothetical protein CRN75_11605 [Yersinia frederiksenii]EEQ16595.1 hypothetical protein yfred0001_6530 [Yersinia frederiksenii ATCC 33641]KGA44441.1 hypothetical protein DJ58_2975 [Yersinia frederiksenii ATCC 33641]SUP75392.1 Uncharacterized protein conserved in bacteria [Yersinia frederiksenii]